MNALATVFVLLLLAANTSAAEEATGKDTVRNDLPSCRTLYFKESPRAFAQRDYLIVVDRTVIFPGDLLKDTIDRTLRAIRPGDHLEVISFSGLTASEFTYVQLNGWIDAPPSEAELETKIPAARIAVTRQCFKRQMEIGRIKVGELLTSLLKAPLSSARRSEILKALVTISHESLRAAVPREKLVVVISDMLEYSDVASFYAKRSLRLIDKQSVLAAARTSGLVGEFSGARVYVAGAAAAGQEHGEVGLRERRALQEFWAEWFRNSGASVVGWGEPALLVDIQ